VIDDSDFCVALIMVGAVFAPIAVYHRLRTATAEKLDRWQEGAVILFGLRLSAVLPFAGIITWMIEPRWMAWSSVGLPTWLRWLGVLVAACSGSLVAWTFRSLGKNLTDTVVTRKEHTLVTSGPYRYVRHPFYLAFALGLVGVSLATANWFILLSGLVPLGFIVARTKIEEQKLVERFGVEYQDYMRHVGRFVPRLKW
jgi:protein-S-isoprenylcysteine O-methyltransferase Ste14